MDKDRIQKLKFIFAIFIIVLVAAIVVFRIIKYQAEGEKNMPFNLSKIIVVSTAQKEDIEQNATQNENGLGNFNVIQTNDLYISIEKNKNYTKKEEKIKSVSINNIRIIEAPSVGILKVYMPNSLDGETYKYTDEYIVNDRLTYKSADKTEYKNLQIGQNGGSIAISFANKQIGTYVSGEDTEVTYNGTMISKLGMNDEQVKSKISFDLIIELDDGKKYSGNVEINFDCNGLIENGKSQTEITDFSNIIFKRV